MLFIFNVADVVLVLGGLGFLGLGLFFEIVEWGNDLRLVLNVLLIGIWWIVFFFGFILILMVVGFFLLGEGLNEFVNFKLRN